MVFEISIWLVALLTSPNYQSCSNSIEVNDFPQHGGERIILRVMQTRHKKTSLESVVLGARILRFLWVGKSHQSILGWFMTLLNSNIHSFCWYVVHRNSRISIIVFFCPTAFSSQRNPIWWYMNIYELKFLQIIPFEKTNKHTYS